MKTFIHKITGGLTKLSQYLVSFGPFGLLAIAFLDSVMIPMPGGVDAVLGVNKNILAPQPLDDLLPADHVAILFRQ